MLSRTCGLDKNTALHCAVSVWVENDVDDVAAQDSVTKFSENMAECVYTFLDRYVATPSLFEISSDLLAGDVSHILEKESPVEPSLHSKNVVAVVYRSAKGRHDYTREYCSIEATVMTVIPNLGSFAIGYATLMTLTGTSSKIKKGFTNQGHKQQEISSLPSLSRANLKCNSVSKLASKSNKHYLL
ncbi:hypothetical protein KIW84_062782 [Lathyrus oleraceus]|uniref:Uncharacterized protein n=1 Tax=Pisum sativum TaxID=3888 RepID=A0A9D4W9Q1_PEA|nr:hypothetical protein KIW84_062782 [Pisum sativum]